MRAQPRTPSGLQPGRALNARGLVRPAQGLMLARPAAHLSKGPASVATRLEMLLSLMLRAEPCSLLTSMI